MIDANKKILEIKNLNINFTIDSGMLQVLNNINLTISKGEFICIVGASGCGKSTLLRIIGGLEQSYTGSCLFKEQEVRKPSVDRGFVFQESRLFPWLTVEKNVEFGLRDASEEKQNNNSKIKRKTVRQHLELVGLENFGKAYPNQLSGGMQQRASIARALVNNPDMLLLDEPFGALDAFTRINMQQEILKIWHKEKTTMILVTHDIDEAVYLADRVVLMSQRPGTIKRIVRNDVPRPRNRKNPEYTKIRNEIFEEFFSEFETDIEYFI